MAIATKTETVEELAARGADRVAQRERLVAEIDVAQGRAGQLNEQIVEDDAQGRDAAKKLGELTRARADIAAKREQVERLDLAIARIGELREETRKRERAELVARLEAVIRPEQVRIANALYELSQATGAEARLLNDLSEYGGGVFPVVMPGPLRTFLDSFAFQQTDHEAFGLAGLRVTTNQRGHPIVVRK